MPTVVAGATVVRFVVVVWALVVSVTPSCWVVLAALMAVVVVVVVEDTTVVAFVVVVVAAAVVVVVVCTSNGDAHTFQPSSVPLSSAFTLH